MFKQALRFFAGFTLKLDMVRARLRELAMLHHPDRGGDLRTMQDMLNEYHEVLKSFEGTKLKNHATGQEYSYRYDAGKEGALADKLSEVFSLKLQNITVKLVGSWLWVEGATEGQKKVLRGVGLKLSKDHGRHFWHVGVDRGIFRQKTGMQFDDIESRYGVERREGEVRKQLV